MLQTSLAAFALVIASATVAAPPEPEPLAPFVLLVRRNLDESWVWLINNGKDCPQTPADLALCAGGQCAPQRQRSGWKWSAGISPWPPFVYVDRVCKPAIFERLPAPPATPTLALRAGDRTLAEVSTAALAAELPCTPQLVDDGARLVFQHCSADDLVLDAAHAWLHAPREMLGPIACAAAAGGSISCSVPSAWRHKTGTLGVDATFRGAGVCHGVKRCDVSRRVVRSYDFPLPTRTP